MARFDLSGFARRAVALRAVEAAYALLILAWFALPLLAPRAGLIPVSALPFRLYGGPPARTVPLVLTGAVVYLIPLIALLKIAGLFLGRFFPALWQPTRTVPILLNVLGSASAVAVMVIHTLIYARSRRYFQDSSPLTYAVLLLSVACNAFFLHVLIAGLNRRDPAYQEYLEFRQAAEKRIRGALPPLTRPGIQRRLALTFIPLLLAIVAVLSYVLMRDFSGTLLRSVLQNGRMLAERAASVIRANPGDMIGADDYLAIEGRRNASSTFPFKVMAYYRRDPNSDAFTIGACTDRALVGRTIAGRVAPFAEAVSRYNPALDVFEFAAPVTLAGQFIGYVQADYDREVIYEPYFRTQVKVFTIAAVFLYASVFLIYLFGRKIVLPILFLRMSVNAIANVLAGMVRGTIKVNAELLQYRDRVATRDEIKSLSGEIGNMAAVLRGIVPYISASTLRHAARATPTTERKELTFLFTDIRGFTALCERMAPETVVEMLNHYLDIQSSVILANGGDVDKFVGDEVMAMFDGPRKEQNACKAGMEIRTAMAREKALAQLARKNTVSIGIGIHTGPVVFGSIGARDRMDFTSIGDTVNLAARLEGANKTYGTKTLITEVVHEMVKELYLCREIDLLTVKGKRRPVRIYELLQSREDATERLATLKRIFEDGLACYRRQQWPSAEKAFAFLRDRMRDEPSEVFLRRVALFRANPPGEGWDGVFQLTVK
jgi:class 3 adenylate cyclase